MLALVLFAFSYISLLVSAASPGIVDPQVLIRNIVCPTDFKCGTTSNVDIPKYTGTTTVFKTIIKSAVKLQTLTETNIVPVITRVKGTDVGVCVKEVPVHKKGDDIITVDVYVTSYEDQWVTNIVNVTSTYSEIVDNVLPCFKTLPPDSSTSSPYSKVTIPPYGSAKGGQHPIAPSHDHGYHSSAKPSSSARSSSSSSSSTSTSTQSKVYKKDT